MPKIPLSPSTEDPTVHDSTDHLSPQFLLSGEFQTFFQKEQDHAMSLLESSPFLASLLMSYITEARQARTSSRSSSADDEDITALRASNKSLREELEIAKAAQEYATTQGQVDRTRIWHEAEISHLKLSSKKTKIALEEQLAINKELSRKLAKYETSHEDSVCGLPPCIDMNLSKREIDVSEGIPKEDSAHGTEATGTEVEKLKARCEALSLKIVDQTNDYQDKIASMTTECEQRIAQCENENAVLKATLNVSGGVILDLKERDIVKELDEVRKWLADFFASIDVSPSGKLRERVIKYIKGMPQVNGVTIPSFRSP